MTLLKLQFFTPKQSSLSAAFLAYSHEFPWFNSCPVGGKRGGGGRDKNCEVCCCCCVEDNSLFGNASRSESHTFSPFNSNPQRDFAVINCYFGVFIVYIATYH